VIPLVRDIRRIGSAALDLCTVASGGLDLYYERGLSPWDLAAGQLVATEAGALVTGLDGAAPGAEMTVAGAPERHAELVAILSRLRADTDE
jgi:myo-inositol-1(or 4)-monophosphatase